jgi:hypothetical protein
MVPKKHKCKSCEDIFLRKETIYDQGSFLCEFFEVTVQFIIFGSFESLEKFGFTFRVSFTRFLALNVFHQTITKGLIYGLMPFLM